MELQFAKLKKNEQRGSKPRCHLLVDGPPQEVAYRLTAIAAPFATVRPTDHCWMPRGFDGTAEAILPEAHRLLPESIRMELKRWWLTVATVTTRTPNWDVASQCTIDGKPGMLLIEAKAHDQELIKEETGRKSIDVPATASVRRNLLRIDWALRDASVALTDLTGLPWALSRDWNYQMSNRFAWAWKLTDLGMPVVLVYLGFLAAAEMADEARKQKPFANVGEWETLVKGHSRPLFPAEVWGKAWSSKGCPMIPLIKAVSLPLVRDSPLV